jgi:hypothetical protein
MLEYRLKRGTELLALESCSESVWTFVAHHKSQFRNPSYQPPSSQDLDSSLEKVSQDGSPPLIDSSIIYPNSSNLYHWTAELIATGGAHEEAKIQSNDQSDGKTDLQSRLSNTFGTKAGSSLLEIQLEQMNIDS